jgi:hypothetical protein
VRIKLKERRGKDLAKRRRKGVRKNVILWNIPFSHKKHGGILHLLIKLPS